MKQLKTSYKIGNKSYSFKYSGKIFFGNDEILLNHQDNLLEKTSFNKKGYGIVKLSKSVSFKNIKTLVENIIKKKIKKYTRKDLKKFKLEKYHKFIDLKNHYKIVKTISKGIEFQKKFSRKKIETLLSEILSINVSTLNKKFKNKNHKYYLDPKKFFLRIVRPNKNDFNPPHRDAYFDNHANGVNIYIPVAGSNRKSSLPVFPKSHRINEKNVFRTKLNSKFNNQKFSVPLIIRTKPKINLTRPNPKYGQMMIFSSNLIHGGGINDNKDITRFSIELRFWRI
tara:strand:- start:6051 stop:6896 length:846 start_codon:yes stop_codon:yes gene_type:complete